MIGIEGDFGLIQAKFLSAAEHQRQQYNDTLTATYHETLEETWNHSDKILEPGKYYRLRVTTSTTRRRKNGAWEEAQPFEEYLYFKTGNPPGADDPALSTYPAAADEDQEALNYHARQPLKDVQPYVDHTVPAAAGAGTAQLPAYRSYDIGVAFNDSYVELMYQLAGLDLVLKLKDNNDLPVLDLLGRELVLQNTWGNSPDLVLTREEHQYRTLYEGHECIGSSVVESEYTEELLGAHPDLLLLPRKQYRAELWAGDYRIHTFNFTTSRFATFYHHAHSFADCAWDSHRLGETGDLVDAGNLEAVLAGTQDDAIRFEQLTEVFGVAIGEHPQRFEIRALSDAGGSYGLLLESPEPMDAGRIEFSLRHRQRPWPMEEFSGPLKLVDANLHDQWIELLALETSDLSAHIIQFEAAADPGGEGFTDFYTFAGGEIVLAGQRIRVHAGPDPHADEGVGEVLHRYLGATDRTIDEQAQRIRLLDNSGNPLHQRVLYSNNVYVELEPLAIWNADASRAFLFDTRGGALFRTLADGRYRLHLEFNRDPGDGRPVLKRLGSSANEAPYVEFDLPATLPDAVS